MFRRFRIEGNDALTILFSLFGGTALAIFTKAVM